MQHTGCKKKKNQRSLSRPLYGQTLRRGKCRALCGDNVCCVKYKDKRDTLTTIHGHKSESVPAQGHKVLVQKPSSNTTSWAIIVTWVELICQIKYEDNILPWENQGCSTRNCLCPVYRWHCIIHTCYIDVHFFSFSSIVLKALIFGHQEGRDHSTSFESDARHIVAGQHFPGEIPQTTKKRMPKNTQSVLHKVSLKPTHALLWNLHTRSASLAFFSESVTQRPSITRD